ncbi:MAG: shikimate kinase [Parascardovia denticolens]
MTANKAKRIVFIGMPGAGKSRIGWEVSKYLQAFFADSDKEIAKHEGTTTARAFTVLGEPAFRRMEHEVIAGLIGRMWDSPQSQVLSLGGGSVTNEDTRRLLQDFARRGGQVVYLDTDVDDAIEQATRRQETRPVLGEDSRGDWLRLYRERKDQFLQAATVIVSVRGKTPQGTALTVLDALEEKTAVLPFLKGRSYLVMGRRVFMHLPQTLSSADPHGRKVLLVHTLAAQADSDKARGILRRKGYEVIEASLLSSQQGLASSCLDPAREADFCLFVGDQDLCQAGTAFIRQRMPGLPFLLCPSPASCLPDLDWGQLFQDKFRLLGILAESDGPDKAQDDLWGRVLAAFPPQADTQACCLS